MIGDANADFFAVLKNLRQAIAGVEDEGERTGQVAFHQFEGVVVDLSVFADVAEVVAYD